MKKDESRFISEASNSHGEKRHGLGHQIKAHLSPLLSSAEMTAKPHPTAFADLSSLILSVRVLQTSRSLPHHTATCVDHKTMVRYSKNIKARIHEMRLFVNRLRLSVDLGNCCPNAIGFPDTIQSWYHGIVPMPLFVISATRPPITDFVIQGPCCALAVHS